MLGILGLGNGEMFIVLIIVLLFVGGSKLPDLARGLGTSVREFKKASAGGDEKVEKSAAAREIGAGTASTDLDSAADAELEAPVATKRKG